MARKNPKNPDATRPLSCVLYIRVSTKLQVEKGESIDAQRFELTRYAEAHGRHEAIIDEATWAAAQAIVGTRKPNAKRHDDGHVNLLNGLLVCPECGRKMSSHPNRGKVKKDGTRGKTTYAYYCPHTSKARGATCTRR